MIDFGIILAQYILRVYSVGGPIATDFSGNTYIFFGKINGVLMGILLLASQSALLFHGTIIKQKRYQKTLSILGIVLPLLSFIFVFNAKNGVGIAIILFVLWAFFLLVTSLKHKNFTHIVNKKTLAISIGVIFFLSVTMSYHLKSNEGWSSLIEDITIAIQVDKYPNWRDPQAFGYPIKASGGRVTYNTYERVAWATSGVVIFIPENIIGIGILKGAYPTLLKEKFGKDVSYIPSTHSAWIEFGLAYGWIGFFLMLATASSLVWLAYTAPRFRRISMALSTSIFLLYLFGELSVGHSLEILFFFFMLIGTLEFPLTSFVKNKTIHSNGV